MLRESVESKMLCAVDTRDEAVLQTDVTFLTVGTPKTADGRIDLRHVVRACEEIGRALKKKKAYHLIIIKSTVVPGTTRDVVKPILERTAELSAGSDFGLCMNPEFYDRARQSQTLCVPIAL